MGTSKRSSETANPDTGFAGSDVGIDVSHVGILKTERELRNSDIGIGKSEKQFTKTSSGALNSEMEIRESLKGISKAEQGFGDGKTRQHRQLTIRPFLLLDFSSS